MKLLALCITALSLVPSLISAIAVPANVVAPRNGTSSLEKRGGEVNYLSNCWRIDPNSSGGGYHASYIAWYSNVDNSQGGQRPNSLSSEYRDWSAGGEYLTWEGQQQNIYFPDSGVTLLTHIDWNAKSRAFAAYAGFVQRTSDNKVFNCYRDSERQIFLWSPPVPDGTSLSIACLSEYWCV